MCVFCSARCRYNVRESKLYLRLKTAEGSIFQVRVAVLTERRRVLDAEVHVHTINASVQDDRLSCPRQNSLPYPLTLLITEMSALRLAASHSSRVTRPAPQVQLSAVLAASRSPAHADINSRRTFLTVIEQGREAWRLRLVSFTDDFKNNQTDFDLNLVLERTQLACHQVCT